jgi:hypothetical protein
MTPDEKEGAAYAFILGSAAIIVGSTILWGFPGFGGAVLSLGVLVLLLLMLSKYE